jgi:hypothetical protein
MESRDRVGFRNYRHSRVDFRITRIAEVAISKPFINAPNTRNPTLLPFGASQLRTKYPALVPSPALQSELRQTHEIIQHLRVVRRP